LAEPRTPERPSSASEVGSGSSCNPLQGGALPRYVVPQPVPEDAPLDHPSLYFNRELGWLDFNSRVLHQTLDPSQPLLERVRFLAIACSNLDEFFQKRVGGLKRQEAAGVVALSDDGRTPSQQLALVRDAARSMHHTIGAIWQEELIPKLEREAGIHFAHLDELPERGREALRHYFQERIYPVLTPLAVDPGHPFPFVSNLSLSLAVLLRHPARQTLHFARLKVPTAAGRWLPVPSERFLHQFVPLEAVVREQIGELFPGMEVISAHTFRVTRNADVRRDEEEAEDLLASISEEVRERRFAPVVRLEIDAGMPQEVQDLLLREFDLGTEDLYPMSGPLALVECAALTELDLPALKHAPWEPVVPAALSVEPDTPQDIFSQIRHSEVLVHHPYDSFSASVQRLMEEAAEDPQVLAIKMTLYRTSDDSPVLNALLRAANHGKHVAVMVEVKARFDEANNIEWGQMLEDGGVHVTYGLVGLKTHAKVALIVRSEEGVPRTYCHIGTGNYHATTARLYTDFGLLTCDPAIGRDVVKLFHSLTGYAPDQRYERLVVAPRDMRGAFERMIAREAQIQREGGMGRIVAKMNAIDDAGIIRELYRASQAGVQIDLIVRGHSRLRPGVPGYSDNIRIISIIGRFLEHDRVFYFRNDGEPEVYIGSLDWRQRNLGARVEAMVPIQDPSLQSRIIRVLDLALLDNALSWELGVDGYYRRRTAAPGEPTRNLHDMLSVEALLRAHRPPIRADPIPPSAGS
jgi:polyphosphate kinase